MNVPKIPFICFLILHLPVCLFPQVIRGIVLDEETQDTIPFASVYISGTFVGTYSDEHGKFSLDLSGKSLMPLTISAVGYYSAVVSDYEIRVPIRVLLSPKVLEMDEVVVQAESLVKKREANLRLFRREFLGSSVYASSCRIKNENDITFNYYSDKDTIKAYAGNPLEITNRLLGYKLIYYLDEFAFARENFDLIIRGNILFIGDLADSTTRSKISKRRRHAYLGSAMHFFRTLWKDDFKGSGFSIFGSSGYLDDHKIYENYTTETENLKYLCCAKQMSIMYGGKFTDLELLGENVLFNRFGQYDYTKILWKGDMADLRIGDWLPYEYQPSDKATKKQREKRIRESRPKRERSLQAGE